MAQCTRHGTHFQQRLTLHSVPRRWALGFPRSFLSHRSLVVERVVVSSWLFFPTCSSASQFELGSLPSFLYSSLHTGWCGSSTRVPCIHCREYLVHSGQLFQGHGSCIGHMSVTSRLNSASCMKSMDHCFALLQVREFSLPQTCNRSLPAKR